MKKLVKLLYRKFLYSYFKDLEKSVRTLLFGLCSALYPKFNSYRLFGVPRGVENIEGEDVIHKDSFSLKPPKTLDKEILPKFFPFFTESGICKIASVKNGFATALGATLTEQGKLIPEFTEQFTMKSIHRHKLFTFKKERFNAQIPYFDATVALFGADCYWNYYHWLFDVLPKLHIIKTKGITPDLYYVSSSKPFQKETLEILGIDDKKIVCADKYPSISAKTVIATSFPAAKGYGNWVCDFLRKEFITPSNKKGGRIYVSRKEAPCRRILNEEEIVPHLTKNGFQIVQTEKLSFKEQVNLFQSADVIVAPHGAGLSNLVFARPQTKVLEIFAPRSFCTCFWALSA